MAGDNYNTVILDGNRYKVVPGSYQANEVPYFAEQRRSGQPTFQSYVPEVPTFWESWHKGYGELYYQGDDQYNYYTSNGLDASIERQITLATIAATTAASLGAPLGELISFYHPFKGKLYGIGSTHVWSWNPSASPNGWTPSASFNGQVAGQPDIFTVAAAASQGNIPGGQYLYIPTASSQFLYDGTTWRSIATQAAHFQVINNELWKVFYDAQGVWSLSKSLDGVTYPNANILPGPGASAIGNVQMIGTGIATTNALMNYDNRLYLLTTDGILTIDQSGTFYDVAHEVGDYLDPKIGQGSGVFHGIAYIPTQFGLLSFTGSSVLNPQTIQTVKSLGPDVQSWAQSDVRGRINFVTPYTNFMFATMTSASQNGYLLRFRDYPGLAPGEGWHPLQKFPGAAMGAARVISLDWNGTGQPYPLLWFSGGVASHQTCYQMALPTENDNPLVNTNVLYQSSGTLDLPILDDGMPTLTKAYIRFMVDLACPSGTSVEMYAAIDNSLPSQVTAAQSASYTQVGGTISGTTGVLEFDFPFNVASGSRIQPRLKLIGSTGAVATSSPVVRSIVMHHLIRPIQRKRWEIDLVVEDNALPGDNTTAKQKVSNLLASRNSPGPVIFEDLLGLDYLTTLEDFSYRETERSIPNHVQFTGHVVLQDYALQHFYSLSSYTMISLTS